MQLLNTIVRDSFPIISRAIPFNQNRYTHNRTMLKKNAAGERTFEGKYKCGSTSYVLGQYLKNKGFPITYHYYREGYVGAINDHLYIRCEDTIIDPTYRQFFTSYSKNANNYLKYLYDDKPYCFNGTSQELIYLYNDLQERHYVDYNYYLEGDTLRYWLYSKEVDFINKNKNIEMKHNIQNTL